MNPVNSIAGVDEAGRGPLAGPVVAAAVILPDQHTITGLNDSKKLTPKRRAALADDIKVQALAWAVAESSVAEIDRINILQASLVAMQRAVAGLSQVPHEVLVDGNICPSLPMPTRAIVGGDGLHASISAASILAKVARDEQMLLLDQQYPGYGFAQHKGYGTKAHLAALTALGACAIHRRSFAPVRACLQRR